MITETTFLSRDLITIDSLSKDDIIQILDVAAELKSNPQPNLLQGQILASCFFEPSTRTRLSFEAAMHRLGGSVIGFSEGDITSTKKGESLKDSMKMMEYYSDIIVIRHPLAGSAQCAADTVSIPVVNAGDGSNEHPTQTLLDLFTIRECYGSLDELSIAMVGDLKHGRTVHSLARACQHFNIRLFFVSPASLEMPKYVCDELREKGVKYSFHHTLEEVLPRVDILYMTRIQEERFPSRESYEQVKDAIALTPELLKQGKDQLKVLHPLPRLSEIPCSIDSTPHAHYFQQAENGLYVRQALLVLLLRRELC